MKPSINRNIKHPSIHSSIHRNIKHTFISRSFQPPTCVSAHLPYTPLSIHISICPSIAMPIFRSFISSSYPVHQTISVPSQIVYIYIYIYICVCVCVCVCVKCNILSCKHISLKVTLERKSVLRPLKYDSIKRLHAPFTPTVIMALLPRR
jgi:hypothetical protein